MPNHIHQFTPTSLDQLLARFGYKPISTIASWPYNTFGYTQGLLNILTGSHNYLYYLLKRQSLQPKPLLDLVNALLLPILVPTGWILGLLDTLNLKSQGVITACYEKGHC